MNASALTKLWTALGSILAYYSANAWLHDRNAGLLFDVLLIDERRVPNAYFSIIIVGTLLILTCKVGAAYAKLQPHANWAGRIPVVFVDSLMFDTRAARLYQAAVLFAFVVLPAGCLLHMCNQLYKYGALFPDVKVARATSEACLSGMQSSQNGECVPEPFRLKGAGILAAAIHVRPDYCIMEWHDGYPGLLRRFDAQVAGKMMPGTDTNQDLPEHNACRDSPKLNWTGGVTWIALASPLALACSVIFAFAAIGLLFFRLIGGTSPNAEAQRTLSEAASEEKR